MDNRSEGSEADGERVATDGGFDVDVNADRMAPIHLCWSSRLLVESKTDCAVLPGEALRAFCNA